MKNSTPWLVLGSVLLGAAIFRYSADKEESTRKSLLRWAVFLAEQEGARVVGVHFTMDGRWQVVPLADVGAALQWAADKTGGGHRPYPGTFTVWVDKGREDWRQSLFANAIYGRGRGR